MNPVPPQANGPCGRRHFLKVMGAGLSVSVGSVSGAAESAGVGEIRVVCYNIHHGEGMDGKLNLDRIAGVIKAQRPTHVALQEVDQGCRRSGGVKQAEHVANALGLQAHFSSAMPYDGGHYGTAILTPKPLETKSIQLPGLGGEPRAAALAAFSMPGGGRWWFGSLHLDHESRERREGQVKALLKEIGAGDRLLLCGDFNAGAEEAVALMPGFERLAKSGPAATYPASPAPDIEIDHAFVRSWPGWRARKHEVLGESVASDHRPFILLGGTQAVNTDK